MRFKAKKVNDTKVRDLKFTRCYSSPWLYSGFRLSLFFLTSVILFLFLFPPLPGRCFVPDDLDFVPMEAEKTITVPSINYRMVYIPPVTFMMGSPKDDPNEKDRDDDEVQHKVTLTQGFYLGATEVTMGQFRKFVHETGYKTEAEKGDGAYMWIGSTWEMKKDAHWQNPYFEQEETNPVVCISWNDTKAFGSLWIPGW